MEARLDKRWHELGGFWEAEDQLLGTDDAENIDIGRGGLDQVFASISAVKDGEVAYVDASSTKLTLSRASHNPYYVAQKMVILGRSESLLDTFADRISSLEDSVAPE
jgi:nuclear pore complex protein Nup107